MKEFERINIKPQTRHKTTQKRLSVHIGYDTETLHGYCRLICDSRGNYEYFGENPNMENDEILYKILSFLIRNSAKEGLRWFYNIDYDFRAIIKYLPDENLIQLYNTSETVFKDFTISFLPSKFFRITKNGHSNTFYDISHFFAGGLDKNAEKYLNMHKLHDTDSSILGESKRYWHENKYSIIEYCIQDCILTEKLADLFYCNLWNEIKFNPKKPYSAGSIAQEFFINNSRFIPILKDIPTDVLKMHQNSYRGGRIEILKRGFFKKLESYDLKSAYPSVMIDLLDYTKGLWIKTTEFDEKLHGIYKIEYNWYDNHIGVFPQTIDGLTIYPNIIDNPITTYANEKELTFLDKYNNHCDYKIISGWQFIPYKEVFPYRDCLLQLFEQKEIAEKENDENKRLIYKLFINSIYGKTAECIYNKQTGYFDSGRLYNPIYCNRITALTRLKLIEASMDISDAVVGFSTDSILTQKPISNKFISNTLGCFTHEYTAYDSVVLMCGVRYIQKINSKNELETAQKMRGFSNKLNLKELLETNRDKCVIKTYINKPLTLFQGLGYNNLTKDDINVFTDTLKNLDINGDMRRLWRDYFINADDCLNRSIESVPIPI